MPRSHAGTNLSRDLHTECDCSDPAHSMSFSLHAWKFKDHPEWAEDVELFVSVQLNTRYPFWQRCWLGLQYAFGKKSKYSYGLWDEGNISPQSARQLQDMLGTFLEIRAEWEAELEAKYGE